VSVEVLNETEYPADAIELVALSRYVMGELKVHPQADLCITLVEEPAFVVEQSGHPRAFTGRAYVPQLLPLGVDADVIH